MRLTVAALLLLASPTLPASAADRKGDAADDGKSQVERSGRGHCRITLGPRDQLAQDADLVIPAGADVESAVALRGSVVVRRGARVKKAVAAGGSVRVEGGAQVTEEAVAISGDVRVEAGGRVDGDAISLGGQVKIAEGGKVGGNVVGLSLQIAGLDLEREVRERLGAEGKCRVEAE